MKYVIDTSSLIYAFYHYPENIFPSFLKKLDTIIEEERLISAEQVYEEICEDNVLLHEWAKKYKESIFPLPNDDEQQVINKLFKEQCIRDLVNSHDQSSTKKTIADPFVIAKAKYKSGCVITEDGFNIKGELKKNHSKLAYVCQEKLDIPCTHLKGFMSKEGWKF